MAPILPGSAVALLNLLEPSSSWFFYTGYYALLFGLMKPRVQEILHVLLFIAQDAGGSISSTVLEGPQGLAGSGHLEQV